MWATLPSPGWKIVRGLPQFVIAFCREFINMKQPPCQALLQIGCLTPSPPRLNLIKHGRFAITLASNYRYNYLGCGCLWRWWSLSRAHRKSWQRQARRWGQILCYSNVIAFWPGKQVTWWCCCFGNGILLYTCVAHVVEILLISFCTMYAWKIVFSQYYYKLCI